MLLSFPLDFKRFLILFYNWGRNECIDSINSHRRSTQGYITLAKIPHLGWQLRWRCRLGWTCRIHLVSAGPDWRIEERYVGAITPASLTSLRLVLVSSTTTPRRPYWFWFTFLFRDSHFKGLHLAFATKKALSADPTRLQSTWGELRSQRWPSKYYHVRPKSSCVVQSPDVGCRGEGFPQVRQVMQTSRPWNSWRLLSTLPTAGRGVWATQLWDSFPLAIFLQHTKQFKCNYKAQNKWANASWCKK